MNKGQRSKSGENPINNRRKAFGHKKGKEKNNKQKPEKKRIFSFYPNYDMQMQYRLKRNLG